MLKVLMSVIFIFACAPAAVADLTYEELVVLVQKNTESFQELTQQLKSWRESVEKQRSEWNNGTGSVYLTDGTEVPLSDITFDGDMDELEAYGSALTNFTGMSDVAMLEAMIKENDIAVKNLKDHDGEVQDENITQDVVMVVAIASIVLSFLALFFVYSRMYQTNTSIEESEEKTDEKLKKLEELCEEQSKKNKI